MRLEQLRSFVAVAELRHFTQAAVAVGVAQPSLSKQIHSLEAELGAPLFTRLPSEVELTPAGETLLPLAQRILADAETAHREVRNLVGLTRGRVRLGATPSLCTSLAPRVLRRFHADHPGIELRVAEGGSQELVSALSHGELDLALVVLPPTGIDPALEATPILEEALVVAAAAGTPLPDPMRIEDLRDRPLVMFRPGYTLRDDAIEACRRAGFEPTFAVEGGELDAVLEFVEAGLGLAVVPEMVLANRPGLRAVPLAPPGLRRTIAIAQRRGVALTHAAAALRDVLRSDV
ncbi:LysR substrate-binding domain-containing protein [Asanoa iriomotensis]|uniref:LysR family transcriptional regulator n=2 Tax=Asanoa iriomotensis TaxID=234613 RepID=A0ABQ4C7C6_9ACTN|nr:LysR family transcriptional regulator [Asanoa iriomotensis]